MYVIYGDASDRVKIQFSFGVPLYADGRGNVLRFAYTQTMLWAVEQPSGPFTATTYSPQLSYTTSLRAGNALIDVTAGVAHDSTGEGVPRRGERNRSRDVNRLFARLNAKMSIGRGWSLQVAPSAYVYALSKGLGADDISDYWGYGSAEISIEQDRRLKLSTRVRGNLITGKGAAELNASYPLQLMQDRAPPLFLFGQVFTGYGESLLRYDEKRTRFRVGVAFVR